MARMFADLHCHPALPGFNRIRNSADEHNAERFHPWNVPASNMSDWEKGNRGSTYIQSDVAKMSQARLRICFASITPIEGGFFRGSLDDSEETSFLREALGLASGATSARAIAALIRQGKWEAVEAATGILRNRGPLRKAVQKAVLGYSSDRIAFMASDAYDYWHEYQREYDYFKARDGVTTHATIQTPQGASHNVQNAYHLIRNKNHLTQTLDHDSDIALLLTIEGGHAFSIAPDHNRVHEDVLFERIHSLLHQPHPILFLTLAHHFDNGLCGHAHSIPDIGRAVMDQTRRMHEGFEQENDIGMRALRALLSLDEHHNDTGGKRILIDVKHMSPRARQELYDSTIRPNLAAAKNGVTRPIPVVMSHAAYSGVRTLDDLQENGPKEHDFWRMGHFSAWGINASDEDIQVIHASDGLIGLVFEQRILGVRSSDRIPDELLPNVVMRHLFAMIDVIMLDNSLSEDEKRKAWDMITLGTDYDGMIDPVACYPTVLDLPQFAEDLRHALHTQRHTRMIDDIGVDELVEKICWKNAHDWLLRHFE